MKILYFINDLKTGGAETQLLGLANRMVEENEIFVLTLWDRGNLKEQLDERVKYLSLDFSRNGIINIFFTLRRILKTISPDIVHVKLFYSAFIMKILYFFMKRDFRFVITQESADKWRKRWINIIDACISRNVDMFIAVSPDAKNLLKNKLKIKEENIISIPNFIKGKFIEENREISPEKIGFIGRNSYAKGVDRFFRFAENFNKIRFTVWLAGKKVEKVPDNCDVFFNRTDIEEFYENVDVVVMTSRWEGMPNVVLEAARFGSIVFIQKNIGQEEIFEDNLIYFKDVEELCQLYSYFLDNPDMYRNKSQELSKFVKNNYNVEKIVKKYHTFYKSILKE